MFLAFLTFLLVTASFLAAIGFALYRVANHLRGNEEATKAVVQHVLLPLFGRKPEVEPESEPEPAEKEVF